MDTVSVSSPSILVIDDDELLCHLFVRLLDSEHCRATAVTNAELGLRLIEEGDSLPDLVLTDLQMPGLDGWDVVEVLTRYCPGLPLVVMSGATDPPVAAALARRGVRLLPKPITDRQLRNLIAPILRQGHIHSGEHRTRCIVRDLVTAAWELHRQRRP